MKTSRSVLILMMLTGFFVVVAQVLALALDTCDEIKAREVLIVGVSGRTPSFGNMGSQNQRNQRV